MTNKKKKKKKWENGKTTHTHTCDERPNDVLDYWHGAPGMGDDEIQLYILR
jgi:hypothetical protein